MHLDRFSLYSSVLECNDSPMVKRIKHCCSHFKNKKKKSNQQVGFNNAEGCWKESTVRKKMAAVHFTTIHCKPNTTYRHIKSPIFPQTCPCASNIPYAKFEVFRTFLCVFISDFMVMVRQELWVNVPVAIFFGTVDCSPICPRPN